jgi:hypothetical protein
VPNDRYANLTPGAVTAALRSFPRRYRTGLAPDATRSPDEIAALTTRDGRTVRQVLADTVEALVLLASSLERVLSSESSPTISDAAAGASVTADAAARESVPDLLAAIELWTMASSQRVTEAPSVDLLRTGTTSTQQKVNAIDIAREAVRVTAENLLTIQNATGRREEADADVDERDDD